MKLYKKNFYQWPVYRKAWINKVDKYLSPHTNPPHTSSYIRTSYKLFLNLSYYTNKKVVIYILLLEWCEQKREPRVGLIERRREGDSKDIALFIMSRGTSLSLQDPGIKQKSAEPPKEWHFKYAKEFFCLTWSLCRFSPWGKNGLPVEMQTSFPLSQK